MTALKRPDPRAARLHRPACTSPRVAARVGRLARASASASAFVTGLISHLAQQPDRWLPTPAGAGATASPRACTSPPASRRSRCCWSSSGPSTRSCSGSGRRGASPGAAAARRRAGLDRCARRRRDLPARHRAGQRRRTWYPWSFSLPVHPLRRRLGRDRRPGRAHRRQAAVIRAALAGRVDATRRAAPATACPAAASLRTAGSPPASAVLLDGRRHRARGCGRSPSSASAPATARRTCRSTSRARGRRGHGQRDRPGVPPRGRVRRPSSCR